MPKITIDGKDFEFKQGQTIIEAAKDAGIDIPHFCWHPKLSISGNCRVCLVEVEKMPKLVIACSTLAADGMVVNTQSEKTLDARHAVMEFILINHPLDCPICDEAGECKLQDYAFQHSVGESRFVEEKGHKDKRVELGPRIMFDGERCISCSRCIRFSDEIAKENQLTFIRRGDRVTITTFPGESFDNPYTLNTVDICPVGALTSKDFRFKSRVWDMSHTKSICVGCSRGCNIEIGVRNNEILRLVPRDNEEVNQSWMCDFGRLNTFKHVNSDTRIEGAYINKDGSVQKVSWEEASKEAYFRMKSFKNSELAFIASAKATLEDNYAFLQLAKSFGVQNISYINHINPNDRDEILIREDKTPNSLGVDLILGKSRSSIKEIVDGIKSKKIKGIFIIEDDLVSADESLKEAISKLDLLISTATNKSQTTENADIVFGASTYAEKNGTFVNFKGRVQRIRPAVATENMERSLDQMAMSRLDKFGTKFDRWAKGKKYDAKPSWQIISEISEYGNSKLKFNMAEEIFDEIANKVPEFKGLDYDVIGELGFQLEKLNEKSKATA
ncbi:MAG: NADH-quinone oxidoreductase subunit G [Ignavibacteriae bacterium]|nr:NADH-quinone oxidoreductase subunit G [Ignavibacteriota bacterium]